MAQAVLAGERRSGLEHYLECGQSEGRLADLRYLNATSGGIVEFYGRQEAAESWLFAGWVGPRVATERRRDPERHVRPRAPCWARPMWRCIPARIFRATGWGSSR